MKVAAFFAGVGGIEEGLHRAGGHETTFFCENDPYAAAVLRDRFGCSVAGDVAKVSASEIPSGVELFTAGFPCQDLSQAGQTRGINGSKSGVVSHLLELLEETHVPWLFIENVSFMLRLDRGDAMRYLTRSLERLGYSWAYRVVDTRSFGLPQRRERVFLLASREADPARLLFHESHDPVEDGHNHDGLPCGFYWTEGTRGLGWAKNAIPTLKGGSTIGIPSPPAIWFPEGHPDFPREIRFFKPSIEDAEALQGFDRGWTRAAAEVDRRGQRARWKLVGNAVSVDAAKWVGDLLSGSDSRPAPKSRSLAPRDGWPTAAHGSKGRRYRVMDVTTWPQEGSSEAGSVPSLAEYIVNPVPLSARAARGFQARFEDSRLRKPAGFLDALEAHAAAMETSLDRSPEPRAAAG